MFSKTAIKRPITTIMVMLIVILGGIVSYLGLNLDLMPSMDIPVAIVSTSYVGAGPEEIESLITKPLEEALGTVSNVDSITSTSSTGSSTVVVMFADGTDVDMAALDMREKVDMVKSALPSDASEPMVLKIDTSMMSSIAVGIKSDVLTLTEINTLSEDTLVQRFEKIEGIASVSVVGGIEQEIEITIKPEKMQGYGITVSQVSQKLAAENLNYPTGSIRQGKVSLQVRSEGKFSSIDEIKDLPINTAGGGLVHLRDIAEINLVEKDQSSYAIIDGAPAIMLTIQKQSNANVVDISEKIIKEMSK
ncbi:MAG: efflux RND transporter permease subunit, partial [Anaerotignaceae bacterium]